MCFEENDRERIKPIEANELRKILKDLNLEIN